MNGQQGAEQPGQGSQESHLSYLLNAANGQASALMGYHALGQRLGGFGVGDASLEEQILQRASALRAEAFMQQHQQQQQQAHQRQHHLGAALAALQQQQQLSTLAGLNPSHLAALSAQEQEALLGRSAALRELGISAGHGNVLAGVGMERLQQLELGRLEELERRRQQLAALAGFSGAAAAQARPNEIPSGAEQLGHDSAKSDKGRMTVEKAVPPSNSAAEKTKDELRKTPGTVIVPCRARGMPMDHNFKTAYFVISEEAKHGEDLVCSYFACRNGGVKFRYCAHCMAPVAKRNFCRRHDHGMAAKGEIKDDDDDDASMDESDPPIEKPMASKKPEAGIVSSLDVLSKAASSIPTKVTKEPEVEAPKRKKSVEEKEQDDDDGDDDEADLAQISKKRRKMWSALLIQRPRTKDPRHLSSWLNEVLTVSDFDSPFEQMETSESKPRNGSTPTKNSKPEDETEVGSSSKKERKSTGEKKKRKSDKMTGEKAEASKPKKEKPESKKKAKSPPKEKPKASKEAVKPKETSKPKELVKPKDPKETSKPKEAVKPKEAAKPKEAVVPKHDDRKPREKTEASKDSTLKAQIAEAKGDAKVKKLEPKETPVVEEKKDADSEQKKDISNTFKEKCDTKKENATKDDTGKAQTKERSASAGDQEPKTTAEKGAENGSPSRMSSNDGAGKKDDDGFARSFADWRDRKKEKAKKGPGLLKK